MDFSPHVPKMPLRIPGHEMLKILEQILITHDRQKTGLHWLTLAYKNSSTLKSPKPSMHALGAPLWAVARSGGSCGEISKQFCQGPSPVATVLEL